MTKEVTNEYELRRRMVEVGRWLWERNFIAGTEGNLSVRLAGNLVLATPTGRAKGRLEARELVVVDHTGKVVGGEFKPSSEVRIHLAAYRLRKDICAVIHAHPCAVVAHSMVGAPLVPAFNPEVLAAVGPIAEVEYEASGSAALAALFEDVLVDHNTFIMARHGAVTLGLDLEHAYDRLEMLEQTAQMQVMAGCLSP